MFKHRLWTHVVLTLSLSFVSLAGALSIPKPAEAAGTTFYVDASMPDDSGNGTSTATAWKSLTKVNSVTFQPGDKILFKADGIWTGQLHPGGSGSSAGGAIAIDMYGTGNKPIIDGNGMTGQGVVFFSNQQYWEINNLEITNDALTEGDRRGIEIIADTPGTINHFYIRNNLIHDIEGSVGGTLTNKKTAAIYFEGQSEMTQFNDIVIENNVIHDVKNQGIVTNNSAIDFSADEYYPGESGWNNVKYSNLAIRSNTIYNISKNAMIVRLADGGVVEYNVAHDTATGTTGNTMFTRSSRNTVLQYNEGYLNRSPGVDGNMYDPDLRSPGTVWQYSYSHDNSHGLIWFCTDPEDSGLIVRYNISQNDKGNLVYINYAFTGASIYNNTFFIGSGLSPKIIRENPVNAHTYSFDNNIIYNNSSTAGYVFASSGTTRSLDSNTFYGQHPTSEPSSAVDTHKLTSDPMLVGPGTGGIGRNGVDGYRLLAGSPAIGSGKVIASNGGKDYWGNTVSPTAAPNRGAYGGAGVTYTGFTRQTEDLLVTGSTGERHISFADTACSGGRCTKFSSDGVGDNVIYGINIPQPGTYNVKVGVKKLNDRGKFQLSGAGSPIGTEQDLYSVTSSVVELNIGNVTYNQAGDKGLKFTVTGKNAASSDYILSFDYVVLTKQ
ncbi:hypothetical protein [Paenibacillus qinlingensis]|uniref:Right handed beta helix domain-containing protein n=1 Tax=Paenibacillus qinlingensis TaxID=1837343 RepID=A0ABU1NUS2_9BACL|nr:hypothetical protein [Paenibacillus qinlingensis]MDR6550582.1 hypothetical protein [Paenibacillus qinlingensis]